MKSKIKVAVEIETTVDLEATINDRLQAQITKINDVEFDFSMDELKENVKVKLNEQVNKLHLRK